MKQKSDPRHSARKLALAALFSWLFYDSENAESVEISKELVDQGDADGEITEAIISGVKENIDLIDNAIKKAAPEWPIEKISKVDLVILRIAVFELLYGRNTPVKVAIDEAIELSKEFGNDTSHKFVNGVLGTIVETFADRLRK